MERIQLLSVAMFVMAMPEAALVSFESVTLRLAQHLHISNCILPKSDLYNDASRVKIFSKHYVLTSVIEETKIVNMNPNASITRSLVALSSFSLFQRLSEAGLHKRIPAKLKWLLHTETKPSTLPTFLPIDSEFWLAYPIHNDSVEVDTLYQITTESPQISSGYGVITNGTSIHISAPTKVAATRRNFQGAQFFVYSLFQNPCFLTLVCIHFHLWEDFSKALNFTIVIIYGEDELKMRFRGRYDGIGTVFPLANTPAFAQFNMLAPTMEIEMNMYFKNNLDQKTDYWGSYARPLAPTVWYSIGVCLLLSSIALVFVNFIQGSTPSRALLNYSFTPLEALCNQGGSNITGSLSSRGCILASRLMGTILFPAYGAAIISFLTVQFQHYPFKNIEEFRQAGTHNVGSLAYDNYSVNYFKDSSNENMRDIGSRLQVPDSELMVTYGENIDRLCTDPHYAFIGYNNHFEQHYWPCEILKMPQPITYAFVGLRIEMESTYKPILKIVLLKMYSAGVKSRMEKAVRTLSESSSRVKFTPIQIKRITFPFFILLCGVLTASMVLYMEKLYWIHFKAPMKDCTITKKRRRIMLQDAEISSQR